MSQTTLRYVAEMANSGSDKKRIPNNRHTLPTYIAYQSIRLQHPSSITWRFRCGVHTPVGLLDTSGGGCGLASGLGGQLLAGRLAAGGLAGCLLGASHCVCLLLLRGNEDRCWKFMEEGENLQSSVGSSEGMGKREL